MGRQKNVDMSNNLEAFNDILTCLAGVLIFILILVSLDSNQSKILIPTPINRPADSRLPIWIEVDASGVLHPIPVDELIQWTQAQIKEATERHGENAMSFFSEMNPTNGSYRVNFYAWTTAQRLSIEALHDAKGHEVAAVDLAKREKGADWFGQLLSTTDKNGQYLAFTVRSSDEAFKAFKLARARAWLEGIRVAYVLRDNIEPLEFAYSGEFIGWQ
jgi:hypothetical protein